MTVLIDLLRSGSEQAPDRSLIEAPGGTMTYRAGLDRAERLARGLRARHIDRFACLVSDSRDLVALLCAASAVGSEPCVYADGLDSSELERQAVSFGHDVIVTDEALASSSSRALPLRALLDADDGGSPPPGEAPILILTTGTTGRPKGARHDWSRLVGAVRGHPSQPPARWLLSYNLNQFAGIQVLVHVLATHATLVVPASKRPRDAMTVIRDKDVTHLSATPTFWRYVAASLDRKATAGLDVRQITLGGEAVPEQLLVALRDMFPRARISQVYAATEFGSSVSVGDGRSGLPLSVLDRGDGADVRMRIVDGELEVWSRVGMLGYHGEHDSTDGWRPTGDLVEVRGDRICFVGRRAETINVGGVKVHPLPVEEVVAAVDGVELVRAYGHPNPVAGQIVAVDVVAVQGVDVEELEARIRAACAALPRATCPRRIRFVAALETKGHKLVRRREMA